MQFFDVMQSYIRFASASIVGSIFAGSLLAQSFDLVDPAGVPTGKIEVGRGRLVVYEHTGERIYFSRDRHYDSRGGLYLGYFNFDLNRVMRFPRSGVGPLQVADFDDRFPRYTTTVRRLRRSRPGSGIAVPLPGFVPAPSLGATQPGFGPGGFGPGAIYPPVISGFPHSGGFGFDPYGGISPGPGSFAPGPFATGSFAPTVQPPQSIVLDSTIIPGPRLEPARVTFLNDGPRPVEVVIEDLQDQGQQKAFILSARQTKTIKLFRDSTDTRIQNVRTITPDGDAVTREVKTRIPPSDRYAIVVREQQMQSIAIDRTPGGNNAIEDINFTGKGLGRFVLPPGDKLQPGTIDVYSAAKQQGNGGTVSPVLAEEDRREELSPLERVLRDSQRR